MFAVLNFALVKVRKRPIDSMHIESNTINCVQLYIFYLLCDRFFLAQLFRVNLRSPLDLFPKPKNYFELWPGDQKPTFDQWTWVSLRTRVDGPFQVNSKFLTISFSLN